MYLFVTVPDLVATDYDISVQVANQALMVCNVTNIPPGTTITYQWRRPDMSSISEVVTHKYIYIPYVGVSDAGVYKCEVNISDPSNSPYVISQSDSVSITLTVTSK